MLATLDFPNQPSLETIELVLVKCRIFFAWESSERQEDFASDARPIGLAYLSDIRKNPTRFAQNIELCTSVDMAETELSVLHNCIVVETSPFLTEGKELQVRELANRMRLRNVHVLRGGGLGSNHPALLGEVMLTKSQQKWTDIIKKSVKLDSTSPLLLSLPFTSSENQVFELLDFLPAIGVSLPRVLLSGLMFNTTLCEMLLKNTSVNFVLDPNGVGLDDRFGGVHDESLADLVLPLIRQYPLRFVLGVNIQFAIQLKRFGGDGYAVAGSFLDRLRSRGLSPKDCEMLAKNNAIRILSHRPVPVLLSPQLPEQLWVCKECGKFQSAKADFFESHDFKFCSISCMREFRRKMEENKMKKKKDPVFSSSKTSNAGGYGVSL